VLQCVCVVCVAVCVACVLQCVAVCDCGDRRGRAQLEGESVLQCFAVCVAVCCGVIYLR